MTRSGRADIERVIDRTMLAVSRARGPVVLGPWASEVGYELLYWIPFLRWAQARYGLAPDRCVALSRGGVSHWYADVATGYVDLLDRLTPAEFVRDTADRMLASTRSTSQKQLDVSLVEQRWLRLFHDVVGEAPALLHPSLLYHLRLCHGPVKLAEAGYLDIRPMAVPPRLEGLPLSYTAVRLYVNGVFPARETTRAHVQRTVLALAEAGDVVIVEPGCSVDDHTEMPMPVHSRVHRTAHVMTPATNLGAQTAIVAHAQRLVSSYGGYSYLAPLLGVDAVTCYADDARIRSSLFLHLDLARVVFTGRDGFGRLSLHAASQELAVCA